MTYRISGVSLLILFAFAAAAQEAASLSGVVVDPSGAVVPGARLKLFDPRRGETRAAVSDELGLYLFAGLEPGEYVLSVAKDGFSTLTLNRVLLRVRDRQSLRLELPLGSLNTTVTVNEEVEGISSESNFGVALDSSYSTSLPLPGRSVDALVFMAPGVTNANGARGGGEINVNGLRSNTNYYTLDGVSLNATIGGTASGPVGGGRRFGGVRAGDGAGGAGIGNDATQLVALDSVEEVQIQTSAISAEFGRTPGAQIAIRSRAGGNQFHGSAFEYFGNDRLNANEWFANAGGLDRGQMRLNQFGGTFGGPIAQNRTFFFASYEGLRVRSPETSVVSVPDNEIRQTAPESLQPYLAAFPVSNGPLLDGNAALFSAVVSNPHERDAASLRIDHALGRNHSVFARYSVAPSETSFRGDDVIAPNVLTSGNFRAHSLTAALVSSPRPHVINDLRFNYTSTRDDSLSTMDSFGGATPLDEALLFPVGVDASSGAFTLDVLGLGGYSVAQQVRSEQKQFNVVDGITLLGGDHQFKFGADLRLLLPAYLNKPYSQSATFRSLSGDDAGSLLSGVAINTLAAASEQSVKPLVVNFSLYFQDTVKASPETSVTYGIRWDVNPAPTIRSGPHPLALCDTTVVQCGVTQQLPLYDTRWTDFAPRFGFSHQFDPTPGRETVFRFGVGLFRDLGYGSAANTFYGAPYVSVNNFTAAPFPLSQTDLAPPALPATEPFGQISAAERGLRSPLVTQANALIERSLGRNQIFSVGYVGTRGRNLLQVTRSRSASDDYDLLTLATNGAASSYHGLQVQYRRRLTSDFTTQFSYTYGHAIDTASTDSAPSGFATLFTNPRGSSNFDVRHNLNFSGSYRLPAPEVHYLKRALSDWWVDWVAVARTGFPFEALGVTAGTSEVESENSNVRGLFAQIRPDYTGLPVWLRDPNAPGGQRLNPDAFATPEEDFAQGNLGRNALPGFGMSQLDFALRRQIPVSERISLSVMAQAFNIFNSPNFANPSPSGGANLASPNFGVATGTLGESAAGGAGAFGQYGGPRTFQLAVRLRF